ncbi:MAG TPA: tetratricopeptide repeat protein, partial [Acidimicrobiia bacterium]|nr:tetratricopeptide repeat protein [Acidimicrobiia bacterium]
VVTKAHALVDAAGLATSGSAEGVARYDRGVDLLLRYHPDLLGVAEELATNDGDVPMAQAFLAYLSLMSTDQPDIAGARECAAALASLARNDRETAHAAAIDAWLDGNWHAAGRVLDDLLVRWPTDMLALVMGHLIDFFTGNARNLRDRVGRSLPSFAPDDPRTPFVRGLQAFGLEESGDYSRAEAVGLAALDANPDDVWALHAVVHTYEMRGLIDTGISFLRTREADWGSGNLFTAHNWWHLALYLLEAGRHDDALAVYDAHVHNDDSAGVTLEMLDASALLWRLTLDGVDSGDRYPKLATAWEGQLFDEPWYPFNDLHGVVALCGAGRVDDARTVVARLERAAASGAAETGTGRWMAAEVGLPAARAIVAFTEERYDDVVDELLPRRARFHSFGGSHAQRDLLERTLTEAALRAGRFDLARALLDERLAVRDSSVYGLLGRARLLRARADDASAARAATDAETHRARFAAAWTA